MKTLDEIWEEANQQEIVSQELISNLEWHIKNDDDPIRAITLATDLQLHELEFVIAEHLSNEDDMVREIAVGCLVGRLRASNYASIALDLAQNDPEDNVRDLATFSLGDVINKVQDKNLQRKIAEHLVNILVDEDELLAQSGYYSILRALNLDNVKKLSIADPFHPEEQIETEVIDQFKKKFLST